MTLPTFSDNEWLRCPACGEDYLAHGMVTVFQRSREDGGGLVAQTGPVAGSSVAWIDDMSDNPSARRNGLTIDFSCEHCHAKLVLALWQHKGNTSIKWIAK